MISGCENPKEFCPYYGKKTPKSLRGQQSHGCYADEHHAYWPENDYRTPIEKAYRELPENKYQLCRWVHDDVHLEHLPPKKPDLIKMLAQLSVGEEREAA